MARKFDIPDFYRSSLVTALKRARTHADSRKKDLSPSEIRDRGVTFKLARHFGFCYGVENAVEIAYRAVEENPDRRVFLLSEMIHNPHVNGDLEARGVRFLQKTDGTPLVPLSELAPRDVVIIPAFGTTLHMLEELEAREVDVRRYDTTCPFVEKVWKRAAQIGAQGYSLVVHGKHFHEETRATFSRCATYGPTVVVRNLEETQVLAGIIAGNVPVEKFHEVFAGKHSPDYDPEKHLMRLGVVNQTTMLAYETQAISSLLRQALLARFGQEALREHFADTRDTLCYATSENQDATHELVEAGGDICVIVGGYNSSNTSHLAKLCAGKVPAFFVQDEAEIVDAAVIRHLDLKTLQVTTSSGWLPAKRPLRILVTAGASCPDLLVERVLRRLSCVVNGDDDELSTAFSACIGALVPAPEGALPIVS